MRLPVLCFSIFLLLTAASDAMAGRRGLRIDLGSWSEEFPINEVPDECPGAVAWTSLENPVYWGEVQWNFNQFVTSAFAQLNTFYCQYSKPYQPGLDTFEYLNSAIFQEEEPGLAQKIGSNTDNAITAVRYSFLGNYPEIPVYGRQWAFYFFPGDFTIVALYGVTQLPTYEWIWEFYDGNWVLRAQYEGFEGEYFCFDGHQFAGRWDGEPVDEPGPVSPERGCVLPPELMFHNGFEEQSESE